MKNRKGGLPFTIIVLFLIIVGIIITLGVFYLIFFSSGGYQDATTDAFCSMSTSGKTLAGAFPELCKTRPVLITPNNWEECPYTNSMKELEPVEFDELNTAKKKYLWNQCTAEQIAKLSVHCWQLMGEGEANRGYFECYTACISSEIERETARRKLTRANGDLIEAEDLLEQAEAEDYNSPAARQEALKPYQRDVTDAQARIDEAKLEIEQLEGIPEVDISVEFIKTVMMEAEIEEGVKYSDVLKVKHRTLEDILTGNHPCCLAEGGFWSDLQIERSAMKAFWRYDDSLRGKILDGDVISIYFSDDFGGPLSFLHGVRFGDDMIILRYKTSCGFTPL